VFRHCIAMFSAAMFLIGGATAAAKDAKEPTLAQAAIAVNSSGAFAGEFSTLIGIVVSDQEILEILTSVGQRTVFAPTNTAFDGLFQAATDNCVDLTPELVNAVVKYHIVKGRRDSTSVLDTSQFRTLLGARFSQTGGMITDGADEMATIIATDIPATNGFLHAIDKVLLPFPLDNQCEL
jgi:uncharacterized surface protein with fasciclin (FAS1) repeats